jgi:ribose transport system ATP-binding protein
MGAYISFKNISKSFYGIKALSDINFGINKGEIHAIVGENGAGKSTLLKILAGEITNYEGHIEIEGRKVSFNSPGEAIRNGISTVHQELNLCLNLNVLKNIFLGREKEFKKDQMVEIATNIMKKLNLQIDFEKDVRYFPTAQKQMIEIIKAVVGNCKILIMDEPTSSLNKIEVDNLFNLLEQVKNNGVTTIFVSHRIEEVLQIADSITVLRDGHYITTLKKEETSKDEIIKHMVGREIQYNPADNVPDYSKEVLRVENMSLKNYLYDVSFSLYKNEILGIAGLEGSGRYELVRSIFGIIPNATGKVYLHDKRVTVKTPFQSIKSKIGFIARERKEEGIFSNYNVALNISMSLTHSKLRTPSKHIKKTALEQIDSLSIKCKDEKQIITGLSGGNQQKCIVARWLVSNPDILIMEEPTRGIDVGSKSEIFKIIRGLAKEGKSILIISSEMQELLNECNRILVMSRGKIVGSVKPSETTQEEIMALATGIA